MCLQDWNPHYFVLTSSKIYYSGERSSDLGNEDEEEQKEVRETTCHSFSSELLKIFRLLSHSGLEGMTLPTLEGACMGVTYGAVAAGDGHHCALSIPPAILLFLPGELRWWKGQCGAGIGACIELIYLLPHHPTFQ